MSFKVTCVVFDISLLYFLSGKMSFDFPFDLICYCSIIEYYMDVNYYGKEFTMSHFISKYKLNSLEKRLNFNHAQLY